MKSMQCISDLLFFFCIKAIRCAAIYTVKNKCMFNGLIHNLTCNQTCARFSFRPIFRDSVVFTFLLLFFVYSLQRLFIFRLFLFFVCVSLQFISSSLMCCVYLSSRDFHIVWFYVPYTLAYFSLFGRILFENLHKMHMCVPYEPQLICEFEWCTVYDMPMLSDLAWEKINHRCIEYVAKLNTKRSWSGLKGRWTTIDRPERKVEEKKIR